MSTADDILHRLLLSGFVVEVEASQGHVSVFIYERFRRVEGRSAYADNLADALNLASARLAQAMERNARTEASDG